MSGELQPGVDYYVDDEGRYVFTATYLRKRGDCCGNGCRHCPYGHRNVPAEQRKGRWRRGSRQSTQTDS